MARKDVLKGLMDPPAPPTAAAAPPRAQKGAIGAVSRSIADLRARSVVEIDPHLIEAAGLQDRLESDASEDAGLMASIAEYGQQVPVLVRPHPTTEGRFQIVYGRRRVLALRDLGQPVKALIRDLDDKALVLAQGQENTARRDLSFIEKVNFARQLAEAGYERKIICDALSVDKTLASRMLSVADRVPPSLIAMIGAAPSVGRDRWLELATALEQSGADQDELLAMINLNAASEGSDDRFAAALDYLTGVLRPRTASVARGEGERSLLATDGLPLGQVRVTPRLLTLTLRRANLDGFDDWLLENLAQLHRDWLDRRDSDPQP